MLVWVFRCKATPSPSGQLLLLWGSDYAQSPSEEWGTVLCLTESRPWAYMTPCYLQGDGSVSLLLAHICISIRLITVGFGFILWGRFQCTLLGWLCFPILATRWSLSWYLPLFASFLSLWDLFCVSCQAYLLLLVSDSFIFLTQASNQPCLQGALIPVTGESHLTSASAARCMS